MGWVIAIRIYLLVHKMFRPSAGIMYVHNYYYVSDNITRRGFLRSKQTSFPRTKKETLFKTAIAIESDLAKKITITKSFCLDTFI